MRIVSASLLVLCLLKGHGASLTELAHAGTVDYLKRSGDRLISMENRGAADCGYMNLWDLERNTVLLRKAACNADVEGGMLFLSTRTEVSVYDVSTANLIRTFPSNARQSRLQPGRGGKYLWFADGEGMSILSPEGNLLLSRDGDFEESAFFADSLEFYLVRRGSPEIEVFSTREGTSRNISFAGNFAKWFHDGEYFLTAMGKVARVYSRSGEQKGVYDLPAVEGLDGSHGHFWILASEEGVQRLSIYRIGAGTQPVKTVEGSVWWNLIPLRHSLALHSLENDSRIAIRTIDLDGGEMAESKYTFAHLPGNATHTSIQLALDESPTLHMGYENGIVAAWDKERPTPSPVPLNPGGIVATAGEAAGLFAAATASGNILIYRRVQDSAVLLKTLNHFANHMAFSRDGRILAFAQTDKATELFQVANFPDQSLYFYSISDDKVVKKWSPTAGQETVLTDFNLVPDGSRFSVRTFSPQADGGSGKTTVSVIRVRDDSVLFRLDGDYLSAPRPSGDGRHVLLTEGGVTKIYRDGVFLNAVSGHASGWLNDSRFLVWSSTVWSIKYPRIESTFVCDATGQRKFAVDKAISEFTPIADSIVFSSGNFYNLEAGVRISNFPSGTGAAGGPGHILYVSRENAQLVLEPWIPTVQSSIRRKAVHGIPSFRLGVEKSPSSVLFRIELARSMQVTLDILDLKGARIRRIFQGPLPSGLHHLKWEERAYSGRNGPGETLFYRLRGGTSELSGRL